MNSLMPYLMLITWSIYSYSNVFFMFVPYLERHGFPPEQAGVLVGAFYATTTFIRFLGGWIVERAGIRRALTWSAFLCLLAALFMYVAESFPFILAIRLLMGCAYGIFIVTLMIYQSLAIPEETRGKGFVLVTLGSIVCLFTVVPLADWLLARDYIGLFLALPVFVAALCFVMSFRLPPFAGQARLPQAWGTWRELYRETPFWRTAASCFLFGLCDASIVYMPAVVLAMKLTPSSFVVATGLGAMSARILGRNFFNSRQRYVFAGPSLLVMAVFLYLATLAAGNVQLFVCGFLFGCGVGYGYPAHLALIGDLAPARLRAKSSVLVYFCYDINWLLLPVAVGCATPVIGELGAFRLLSILCAVSGVGLSVMWARFAKSAV